jgi:hypothetical protein
MKTLTQIENEIQQVISEIKTNHLLKDGAKQRRDTLTFLTSMQLYLATEPSETYLIEQKKRLENQLKNLDNAYPNWCIEVASKGITQHQLRTTYIEENDYKSIIKKIKIINYLLN